ncbi:hypothetical protein [Daejeonella lutea]|uniref:GLPGLI family protein n=1 Tax=Daejeonella lutea TaxID=572036 RepID=A0A1T5CWK0_9SPHI|nr:hypothetical protein [Daejeonella lutea]SKB63560.1 hypothetical protein SAMN05661099_1936 [Daejeonella lutea]
MKKALLLITLLASVSTALAQYTITYKPGDSPLEFKTKYVYRNPTFLPSRVYFKDGSSTRATLNYNTLSDRMEFIGPKGDTLELVDNHLIKEVVIDKSRFRFHDGFFELIKDSPEFSLALKRPLRMVNQKKLGAMGIASPTAGIETYASLGDVSGILKLSPKIEHIFSNAPIYYFGDKNSFFIPASQKSLAKIFPAKKDQISAYMKNHSVNFTRIEDILSLISAIEK